MAAAPAVTPEVSSLPDPAWLEQLQLFQRGLVRLDEPRAVMERLAREFQQMLKPRLLAIGVARPDG